MERIYVDIIDLCIDEKYWAPKGGDNYKTGHSRLGSTLETYDSCDNCDGALCDKCNTVERNLRWEFKIPVDEAEEMLVAKGVPRDEARDIVTCDGSYTPDSKYRMIIPYEDKLKDEYPDFYKKINEIDPEVISTIDRMIEVAHPKVFGELADCVYSCFHNTDSNRWNGHIYNQLELYWINCKKNHKLACKIKDE